MGKVLKPIRRAVEHPGRQTRRLADSILRAALGAPDHIPPRDVWKWTAPKYRFRTVALLLLNAILFVGLGMFAFWLRTGLFGPFAGESYWVAWWEVFDPTLDTQVTLIDYLLEPIPVDQVPMMMVILGLVLGAMTAIPILVSMLYRFPFSLIFTAIIAFVAVFPWLGMTVTLSCLLARWRPFRFSFRFATALLSMLPLVVYYALATRNASVAASLAPVEAAKLYIPWVLALISACVIMGIVLGIARLVNDRPGAIAPLLALTFAVPVVLFEIKVGRDELYYRLLEKHYGPASKECFADQVGAGDVIRRIARARLAARKDTRATLESMIEQVRLEMQLHLPSIHDEWQQEATLGEEAFVLQQYEAIRACDAFIARFPQSRYVPNVLYLKGRAIDMRVDRELFRQKGIIRHYDDFPNTASRQTWRRLTGAEFAHSPLQSVALYRLAFLEARVGTVDEAVELLERLLERYGGQRKPDTAQTPPSRRWRDFLAKRPASSTLGVAPTEVALQGQKLLFLLKNNRDPQQDDLPLRKLLSFDPRHRRYLANLKAFLADIPTRYPLTKLRDNVEVLITAMEPSRSLKIDGLRALVERLSKEPESDALPHARLELGAAYQEDNRSEEARAVFEQIVQRHRGTPWEIEAGRRLAEMGVTPRPPEAG